MDTKSILSSTNIMVGTGIVVAAALALAGGIAEKCAILAIPFGVGLILGDISFRMARSKRERVKVRVRANDKY